MTYFTFISFFSIISLAYLINLALAIPLEGIVGGTLSEPHEIPYQVAILRYSYEIGIQELICGGGIIAKKLVLTVAKCFLNNQDTLDNYEYSVIADSINWKEGGIQKLIRQFFLPSGRNYQINNIAVVSLMSDLDLDNNPHLSKLSIPQFSESFFMLRGRVSGYGYSYILHIFNESSFSFIPQLWSARSDNYLRYTQVLISMDIKCSFEHAEIDRSKQFCGRMLYSFNNPSWGLCENDGGSPLVINNTIVGLASIIQYDCDDTTYGTAYTNVSVFASFVNSIINNNPLPDTIILNNTRYIQHIAAPAA